MRSAAPNVAAPAPVAAPVQNPAEEVNKLLVLARRAREGSDSKNAKRYYDQILDKAPGNWEAIFYSVYYEAAECKIMYISSAANSVANCLYSTFSAISDLTSKDEQDDAIETVVSSAAAMATMLASGAKSHYNQFSTTDNAFSECSNRVVACGNILSEIENGFNTVFPDKKERLANFQHIYLLFLDQNSTWFNDTYLNSLRHRLNEEIAQVYPEHRKKMEKDAKRAELNQRISTLETQVNGLVIERTASAGCVGWFFLPVGILMLVLGLALMSMEGGSWPILVAIPELIIGALCLKKTPSQEVVDENLRKRDELKRQIDALKKERDAL